MSERTWTQATRGGVTTWRTGSPVLAGGAGAAVYETRGVCCSLRAWAPDGADGFRREMTDGAIRTPEEAQRLASRWLDERDAEAQQRAQTEAGKDVTT